MHELKMRPRLPKSAKGLHSPREGIVFVAYHQLNVLLARYFGCRYGAISPGFAQLLSTFTANSCPSSRHGESLTMRRRPDSELHLSVRELEVIPGNGHEVLGVDGLHGWDDLARGACILMGCPGT